jgi:lysophospholipid acyltransferase (LPLAT)-like uncharacterized protein
MTNDRAHWWTGLAAWLGAGVVRLLGATWRVEVVDHPEFTAARSRGEPCVYAFWHCLLLVLTHHHRREGIAVLVSRHRDGELIARIIERLGYVTARGSSTRGGEAGVRGLLKGARQGRCLGITPDGPRGPAEQVKEGLVYVAARSGLPVVPIAVGVQSAWVMRSWDRFRVPRPFARIRIMHGAPISVAVAEGQSLEAQRLLLERAIAEQTAVARQAVGEFA